MEFITSVGYGDGPGTREQLGLRGKGPQQIITDLGILTPDPRTCEFTMTALFEGVSRDTVRERTGWDIKFAAEPQVIAPPTSQELAALRKFKASEKASE